MLAPVSPTAVSLASAASTSEVALSPGAEYTFVANAAFNINFGATGLSAPSDTGAFPAGTYTFRVPPSGNYSYFRMTANATLKGVYWRSSFE